MVKQEGRERERNYATDGADRKKNTTTDEIR